MQRDDSDEANWRICKFLLQMLLNKVLTLLFIL
jgi:hypothetical protein